MVRAYVPTEHDLEEFRRFWLEESGFTWDELVELGWSIWPDLLGKRSFALPQVAESKTILTQMESNERELLHIREAADQLGVTPSTVRRHITDGELAALRLGANGNLRIRRHDLEQFLQEVEVEPKS